MSNKKLNKTKRRLKYWESMKGKSHINPNCHCFCCKAKRGEYMGKNNPAYGVIRSEETRKKWKKFFKQLKNAEDKKYKNKIVVITATRPDTIKIWPLLKKLKNRTVLIHTGQQKELSENVFNTLKFSPTFNLDIMEKNQSLAMIGENVLKFLSPLLHELKPKILLVHGDTASSFNAALCAYYLRIPIAHLESGLRSFDKNNPYPEEFFRTAIDHMSEILFTPTKRATENLKKEGIIKNIYQVGNTIVDSLELIKKILPDKSPLNEKYVLATIHRRESIGRDAIEIFKTLKKLSKEIKLVLPLHPNPNIQRAAKSIGVHAVPPLNYKTFLWYMKFCEYVISDSGGVSEEASSFKKKIAVIRKKTERPEVMEAGYGILIDKMDENYIYQRIKYLEQMKVNFKKNPFGDGKSTDRIIKILESHES